MTPILIKKTNSVFSQTIFAALLICFTAATNIALAQSAGPNYETYFSVHYQHSLDSTQDDISYQGNSGSFSKGEINKAKAMMIRWGYREDRAYGIEIGYMNLLNGTSTANNGNKYEHSAKGITADLLFFFPINNDSTIYAKIGTGKVTVDSKLQAGGNVYNSSEKGNITTLGFGIEYLVSKEFGVRGGWEIIEVKSPLAGKTRHSGLNFGGMLLY